MQERSIHLSWKRLVTYGSFVIAILLVGYSIFVYVSGEPSALSDDSLGSDLDPPAPPTDEFDPLEPTPLPTEPALASPPTNMVVVYISGAVVSPDTYELPGDARVADVVALAGGLTKDADRDRINLSDHIHDAQHIFIVRLGEVDKSNPGKQQESEVNGGLINLNTASASELESLDGIGKVLAQRIVDWRTTNGPFASTDDLQQVKGVTASIYDKIKDNITVP